MQPTSTPSPLFGHVTNGVVVVDTPFPLAEGQSVRIEPLVATPPQLNERNEDAVKQETEKLRRLTSMFAHWDEEDQTIPDEISASFHRAIERHRGFEFRVPDVK